ncbi:hypothetical protein VSR82_22850 [Burkholderia sp. JPY481]|uniref:hypothetical protein n=1 Tax=unclassified Paraburkholderia TaxID=2615204 RepID=UPI003181D78D
MSRFASSRPNVGVSVQWRSHQLLPGIPVEGLPYQAFYRDRLGSAQAVAARRAEVLARLSLECGLEYTSLTAHQAASKRAADLPGQRSSFGDTQASGVPHFVFNTRY